MIAGSEIGPALLRATPLPTLSAHSDKEERGRVLVVAGGAAVPGAATLTGLAALRVGAGKLQLAATDPCAIALGMAVPEARIIATPATPEGEIAGSEALLAAAHRSDAVIVGPGMMERPGLGDLVEGVLAAAHSATLVIDAAAMRALRPEATAVKAVAGRLILTPHAGEMAGMLGREKTAIKADPLGAARDAAALFQAVVIMKGATTFIVSPDGAAWRHEGGISGLGTSGSGDVLAGAVGGLLARGAPPLIAALWGVVLHSEAGDALGKTAPLGFLAREIPAQLPLVLARLCQPSEPSL